MLAYLVRRLLLVIPTLFGIMVVNFVIIQAAPGGPVDQMIARIKGTAVDATARIGGTGGGETSSSQPGERSVPGSSGEASKYRGARHCKKNAIDKNGTGEQPVNALCPSDEHQNDRHYANQGNRRPRRTVFVAKL